MVRHTPGPWVIHRNFPEMVISLMPYKRAQIANMGSQGSVFPSRRRINRPEKERKANAHLIAAAPDMLEALERIVRGWGVCVSSECRCENCIARVAIAKAKGMQG